MTSASQVVARAGTLRENLEASLRGKAKPVGSLGRLEDLALQIGLALGAVKPDLGKAVVVVFAGDHGLTAEGTTAYPSVVTREIAKLILAGGAGINVTARAAGVDVLLVDCGLLAPLPSAAGLVDKRIGAGTRNSRRESAMTDAELKSAIANGAEIDASLGDMGVGIVGFGEVGIGNSAAAAMLAHAVTGLSLDSVIGPGAGAPPGGIEHKRQVAAEAVQRAELPAGNTNARARAALREFAGFEMATMAGAMLAAYEARRIVVVDGFISTAVAAAVGAMQPGFTEVCVFAHRSAEPGHRALLHFLGARPLLELDMRLGEGTGAALAMPIIRAAELMLREMADLPGEHPT